MNLSLQKALQALWRIFQQDKRCYDCSLLIIQMPEIDGIEFCKALRKTKIYQRKRIIILTVISEKSYIDDAFSAGSKDYITKPFEINSLKGRLNLVKQVFADTQLKTADRTVSTSIKEMARKNQQHVDLHQP